MTSPEGGFYSTEDADSEGIEGKFYVWNPEEVDRRPGEGRRPVHEGLRRHPRGNWDPHEESIPKKQSVLHVAGDGDFADLKKKMFEARSRRIRPHLDDKVLTSWNALMISAMAQAGAVLGEARYREAAVKAASPALDASEGRPAAAHVPAGRGEIEAYLEDYAYLAAAMVDLYEATFDEKYFHEARSLVDQAVALFGDESTGGFYTTAAGQEGLIARMREEYEGPHPTGNSVMTMTLLKLYDLTADASLRERAEKVVKAYKADLERYPAGHAWMLCALDYLKGPSHEIVVAGPNPEPLLKVVRSRFLPNKVVALADGKSRIPVLQDRIAVNGKAAGAWPVRIWPARSR